MVRANASPKIKCNIELSTNPSFKTPCIKIQGHENNCMTIDSFIREVNNSLVRMGYKRMAPMIIYIYYEDYMKGLL